MKTSYRLLSYIVHRVLRITSKEEEEQLLSFKKQEGHCEILYLREIK